MKILVGWDDPAEVELLRLYLSSAENEVTVCLGLEDLAGAVRQGSWEVVLLALTFPTTAEQGYAAFQQILQTLPGVPVVLAYRPAEIIHLARFLNHGLRSHLVRDNQHDFVFYILISLEAAVAAVRAERSEKLYAQLMEYLEE